MRFLPTFCFCDFPDLFCRVAGYYRIRRHIFCDHATSSNHGTLPYRHAGKHYHIGGYPYIIAYPHAAGTHYALVSTRCIKGMRDGAYRCVRADKHVIAYRHLCLIKYRQVEITHKIFPDAYIESEIASERTVDSEIRT